MTECMHCGDNPARLGDLCDLCAIWLEDTDGYYDDTTTEMREDGMRDD